MSKINKKKQELTEIQKALAEIFLVPFESPEQMRDWIYNFFDIDFPSSSVDPDSNSSPIQWMYEVYDVMRKNQGDLYPSYVVYSSRDSYKTLSCSALEVILMVHLKCTVAHMAAIKSQSAKAIQYINGFLRKIEPYLNYHDVEMTSQNTSNISITDANGDKVYTTVIVCTMTGANSEHTNFMCVDEVDVVPNPMAFEEAKMIPGVLRGRFPVTVFTSTRKFAFGLMQKEIDSAQTLSLPIKHWNLIDITERCPTERHQPDLPKEIRYIANKMPLRQLSENDYNQLMEDKKESYSKIEAYSGCVACKLLPVCQTRLAHRDKSEYGGMWKPIPHTINQFSKISPDMAEAQLLCWKPSTTGLVYPRFDKTEGQNILTLDQAYEQFTGEFKRDVEFNELITEMHNAGIQFYVGGDWGFRHNFALVVGTILPSGDFWIVECFVANGLEFPAMMQYSTYIRDKYRPKKWFMDTAQPMFIKSFRKAGMICKDFKKDIAGGIASIRGQIVDAANRRRLKILETPENEHLIKGMLTHHFKVDVSGNITAEPDDDEYADACDSLRYMGQNLFAPKGKMAVADLADQEQQIIKNEFFLHNMRPEIGQRNYFKEIYASVTEDSVKPKGQSSSGSLFWDFSGDD